MRLLSLLSTSICAGLLLTACATSIGYASQKTPARNAVPALILATDAASTPEPSPASVFNQEMLFAVNTARAQARKCGGRSMPAVAALSWNEQLQQAAFVHSSNMATYDFFSHTGLDGKEVSQRIRDEGYNWRAVGENISAGAPDVATVMAGWLSSPGHCANIMSANFAEMGAAVVTNNSTYYGSYWTQVFAASF